MFTNGKESTFYFVLMETLMTLNQAQIPLYVKKNGHGAKALDICLVIII